MSSKYDIVVIGAGINGLLASYELSKAGLSIAVIERDKIGNSKAASGGLTRSIRSDYRYPEYSRMAKDAIEGWKRLEVELRAELYIRTGCLNLGKEVASSYAFQAQKWLKRDLAEIKAYDRQALNSAFPQFKSVNFGVLEPDAGLGLARNTIMKLREKLNFLENVEIFENTNVESIKAKDNTVFIRTSGGELICNKLIIAAGIGTDTVLERLAGCKYRVNLQADRPLKCKYYIPNSSSKYKYSDIPIFANLDYGIYGHPIVKGLTKGVKIGQYIPPGSIVFNLAREAMTLESFVAKFMPDLASNSEICDVLDTDQCVYDMSADGGFIIGCVPNFDNVVVIAGLCGTGYKFAPAISNIVKSIILEQKCRYNVKKFDTRRFLKDNEVEL